MDKKYAVYTIVKRERDDRSFWIRIGSAFKNRDGSMSATLDALPTNGTLHIREVQPFLRDPSEDDDGEKR